MPAVIPFKQMYDAEFNVHVLNAMRQTWQEENGFSCINNPKTKNIFVYLNNCSATYSMKDGRVLLAKSGDVVYTPIGLEYSVQFSCHAPDSFTIGINAAFFDERHTEFIPEGDISIITSPSADYSAMLFSKINHGFMTSPVCNARIKALFFDMLSDLLRAVRNKKHIGEKYDVIKNGILFMENEHCFEKIKIGEIAKMCHVSEVYFRKLFKEYSGMTPVEYILTSKICRAKKYLKFENIGIGEIALLCGFEDEVYFGRIFKKKTGLSPLKYRERVRQ